MTIALYWDLGDNIDMQIFLTDARGEATPWQGYIRKSSIGEAMLGILKPKEGLEEGKDKVGPIGFTIASERGEDPVYKIGQNLVLLIQASRDSYLYCFYKQADGKVMKIFPNRGHGRARIAGGAVQRIPDRLMGFEWQVSEPVGAEQVKCFAADRDVGRRLPKVVREVDFEPLPYRSLADVSRVFRELADVAIAEARMVVSVER